MQSKIQQELQVENSQLRRKLDETEQILNAIRQGTADSVIAAGPDGERVYILRGSEEPYHLLVEEMDEGAITLLRNGTILYCNRRFGEMLELPLDQVLSGSLFTFCVDSDRERIQQLLAHITDVAVKTETILQTARQKRINVQLALRAWSTTGLEAITIIATDITARKRAEKRSVYQAHLLAQVHDAVIAMDARHIITYWNRAAEQMYGWPAKEVTGKNIAEVVRSSQSETERAELERRLLESGHVEYEAVEFRRDGSPIHVAATRITLHAKDGHLSGYVAVNHDITERRHAEDAQRDSEQRFQELFNRTPIPIFVFHREGDDFVLSGYNQAVVEFTRGGITNLVGRRAGELYRDRPQMLEGLHRSFDSKGDYHLSTTYRLLTTGEDKFVNFKFTYVAPNRVMVHAEDITEMKQAEDVLLRQAELLELTHDAIFVRTMSGEITYWNHGAEDLYGWNKDEALGKISHQLLKTQYPIALDEIEAETVRESCWEGELVHTTRDGQSLTVLSRWALQRDAASAPMAILEINRDITKRKQTEEALHASEHRFRLAVDNFPGVFIIYDAERRIQFINTPGMVLSGLREQDLLGHRDEEIYPPHVTAPYLPFLQRAAETGVVQSGEVLVDLPAGAFTEKVTYVPLLDDFGKIQQILGIAEDITERQEAEAEIRRLNLELEQRVVERTAELEAANQALVNEITEHARAEEALRQSEERFRLLAENAQDLIYRAHLAPAFRFEYMSPSTTRILGYTPEEFYADGELIFRVVHPEDRSLLEAIARGELVSEEPTAFRWIRKDGTVIWLEQRTVPVQDDTGQAVTLEGIAREITERKHSQEALQRANQNLTAWARELEQRNREINLLNEMGDLLQSCLTVEEAYRVIANAARDLFPSEHDAGALYMLNPSRSLLEAVATWGETPANGLEHVFAPDNCWSLRRGRIHVVDNTSTGLVCQHLNHADEAAAVISYVCIPMVAQGETLGVLYLQADAPGQLTESERRLAVSVAEHVALAVSSLRLRETLRSQAIRDPLTGLFNRRYMEESLDRELRRASRKKTTVGIIMLDLDHFKIFNDSYGHEVGDAVLRTFGQFLQSHIREGDIACRYGGEEFTLILPETTLDEATERARQICREFKFVSVEHEGENYGHLSVSLGVACFPEHGNTAEALLRGADAALYQAKANGRDQVIIAASNDGE